MRPFYFALVGKRDGLEVLHSALAAPYSTGSEECAGIDHRLGQALTVRLVLLIRTDPVYTDSLIKITLSCNISCL